ncbi:hypothetical protein [Streptomyces sp. NPDC059455]|uniref:hypothetical protein n=1 Tax=Streptomyces sp. NPDC059455 TaxID=3346837 RepID=UPI0036983E30
MFTVTGSFEDRATYTVRITGRVDRPVIGSHRAAALVELHIGETIALGPTGPMRAVAGDDGASILAVLREYTDVIEVSGSGSRQVRVSEK